MRWAFSDESRRGSSYWVAAIVVETHDVNDARSELKAFLRANQRRVHMAKESAARRAQFLALVDGLPATLFAVRCLLTSRSLGEARERSLSAMTRVLIEEGVESWRLEWMGPGQERLDRRAIAEYMRQPKAAEARRSRPNPLVYTPEAAAKVLVWLCHPDADITGATIAMDHGMSAGSMASTMIMPPGVR